MKHICNKFVVDDLSDYQMNSLLHRVMKTQVVSLHHLVQTPMVTSILVHRLSKQVVLPQSL